MENYLFENSSNFLYIYISDGSFRVSIFSVAMTRQDCCAFSVICWYARYFMREEGCPQSARPSGKMRCCCQISTAENYNVFDAKLTQQNQMKKTIIIV